MDKQEIYILGFNEVNFTNKETGEIVQGTSIFYLDHNNFDSSKGVQPSKVFLSPEKSSSVVSNGPGLYNLLMKVELQGNRPRIIVEGFEFIKKATINVKAV